MKSEYIVIALITLLLGVNYYKFRQFETRIEDKIVQLEESNLELSLNIAANYSSIDSLQKQNSAMARTIIYLDSCQSQKTIKSDKAEKRGRFVGGLIKGLFPGL